MQGIFSKILFISTFFLCSTLHTAAQNTLLKITITDSFNIYKIIAPKTNFTSKQLCINYINQLPSLLQSKGYIGAAIDTIIEKENTLEALLYIGNLYTFKKIKLPPDTKNITGIDTQNIIALPSSLLRYYENNGYPFAKINFDSIAINNQNQITGLLQIQKGVQYKMDSIRVWGNANISNRFLQHYLKLFNNSLYSTDKLNKINNRLNQLPYISSYQNWDILMLSHSYLLNLYLQPKNQNKFDAIVGFLPNNNQSNGKLLLTLDAKLNLKNAFASGENIAINWQQIQPQSPRIDIGFATPYIFNSDAGLSFNFNLYKRDSAYLNVYTDIGIDYELTENKKFKIFVSNFSTRIIEADTATIVNTQKLPPVLDINIANLGIAYQYNNTIGTPLNKRKGFDLKIATSFGQKKIKPNTTITSLKTNGFNYNSLYDSLKTNSYQTKTTIAATQYIGLGKQKVLKLAANYGLILTPQYLQNELFQIGGFKLLRGFDEENIFTNQYLVGSVEYRYLLNQNSFFFGFTDAGFTKNKTTNNNYNFIGAGIGLALETKQGLLNISFAAGKRNDLPFNLRETKIHIGIINNF